VEHIKVSPLSRALSREREGPAERRASGGRWEGEGVPDPRLTLPCERSLASPILRATLTLPPLRSGSLPLPQAGEGFFSRVVPAIVAIAFSLLTGAAYAQDYYVSLGVGPIIPFDADARLSGRLTQSSSLQFNAAGFIAGFVGYQVTDRIAVEGEFGWSLYDPRRFANIPLNGDFDTLLGVVHGIYRPFGSLGRWTPYVGAGIGAAVLNWSVSAQPQATTQFDVRGSSVNLALDGVLGLDYAITPHFSMGGRYRYLWLNTDGGTLTGSGVTLTHGNAQAHTLMATGSYRF